MEVKKKDSPWEFWKWLMMIIGIMFVLSAFISYPHCGSEKPGKSDSRFNIYE